jgi:hypothetical protein
MGSPGGFSFLGLPEIIEQIRKILIWWFHERSLNELELAEKCLDIVKKYLELRKLDNESEVIDDLVKKICKGVKIFEGLESEGKLEKIIENIDYTPTRYNNIAEIRNRLDKIESVLEPNYRNIDADQRHRR